MSSYAQKKSGPKPKQAAEYRSARVCVYLTPGEFSHIQSVLQIEANTNKLSIGKAMADHFRRASSGQPAARLPAPAINRFAWVSLARLSSNLNQLAKHANEGRVTGVESGQFVELSKSVERLRCDLLGL